MIAFFYIPQWNREIFHGSPRIKWFVSDPTVILGFLPKHWDKAPFFLAFFSVFMLNVKNWNIWNGGGGGGGGDASGGGDGGGTGDIGSSISADAVFSYSNCQPRNKAVCLLCRIT